MIAAYPKSAAIYAVDIKLNDAKVEADLVVLAKKHDILDRLLFIGNTIQDASVRERLYAADRAVQMAPVAEEGTGGSDMDVTATNASGWTTGV